MDNSSAPDSWEQDMEVDNNLAKNMSNLNVEAKPFVPGQNVFAQEFVPTWTKPACEEPNCNYIINLLLNFFVI